METRSSPSLGAGSILGLADGALLIIGTFLTWATVSLNVGNFSRALGADVSQLPASLRALLDQRQSFAGTSASPGRIAPVPPIMPPVPPMDAPAAGNDPPAP
jgi:hypothetical protein